MKSITVNLDGKEQEKEISDWEVKEAMSTLISASDILQNKEMMKLVKKKQAGLNKVSSIKDLRDLANSPSDDEDEAHEMAEEKSGETMDKDMTPDDKASKEPMNKRIKNSSNPTIVGKSYK